MLLEIATPIILLVGMFGNTVSFLIFKSRKLKGSGTFSLLAYLSIIDFFYLFIGLPHIMVSILFKSIN